MKKPIKIILSLLSVMVLLLVIAILVAPFFVDTNQFKPRIADAVREKLGRELSLDGDIKLSLFPWLGINTGALMVSNAPGFQDKPFASIEASDISVQLLPLLLDKQIVINQIVLKGLVLNLARNAQGINNWSDLTAEPTFAPAPPISSNQPQPAAATDALALFAVGGILVTDAQISWQDAQTRTHWLVKNVNLDSEKFTFNEPVNIALSLLANNLDSGLSATIKFNSVLTVNERLDSFLFNHTELLSTVAGENIPGKSLTSTLTISDAALEMGTQTVKLSGLKLASNDMLLSANITGTGFKDSPLFEGDVNIAPLNPRKLLNELAITLPVMQDPKALNTLSVLGFLHATADTIELQNLAITLDDTHAKGQLSMSNFAQPSIGFNLALDTLDLDRYLPPPNNTPKPLASPGAALAAGAAALPVETLRKLNAVGDITLDKFKLRGLDLQGVSLNLTAKNGTLATQQSIKSFYQGSYSGNTHVDVRNKKPAITLTEKLTRVQLEPLLKGYQLKHAITGKLTVLAQLQAQGDSSDELKSTLAGHVDMLLKDAVIKGFNVQKIIDNGKALIKGAAPPDDSKDDQTLFSEINGTASIKNGLMRNDDLVATSSKLLVDGKGTSNLINQTLDYQLNARLPPTEAGQAQSPPVVIAVTGQFNNLNYAVDASALLTDKARIEKVLDKNKDKINKLMNKLDKKLGPGTSNLLKGFFH